MFKLNKKLMSLALATALGLSFSACGSSDGGDDSSSGGSSFSFTPLVEYTCETSSTYNGKTATQKMGTEGNIVCSKQSYGDYDYISAAFVDGMNEMVISQVTSEDVFNSDSAHGTVTMNLQKGTEHIVGTDGEHGDVDCVNTYDITLPMTISDPEQITDFYIDNYSLKETTCPDWVNAEDNNDDDMSNFTDQSNLTITETSGAVTKISKSYTLK